MKPRYRRILGPFIVAFTIAQTHAASLQWAGSTTGLQTGTNNTWDTNTTANWWNGAALVNWPALGGTDDDAVFGGTSGTVTLTTATANDISFNSTGYTLSGGTLTLNGGTTPALATNTGVSATISSVVAGTVGLNKNGDGTLTLSGANTFTGVAKINTGTLLAGNNAALGSAAGGAADGTTVESGATLDVGGRNLGAEIVTVSGAGVGGNGAIINTGGTQSQAVRFVTLAGNATVGGPNRWDIRGNATATLDMGNFTLTKTGANYMGVVATNFANPGNLVINQGEVNLSTSTAMGGSSTNSVTVNSGGTLGMYQSSVAHLWTLNLNTGSIFRGENGTAAQNNWNGPVNVSGDVTLRAENDQNLTINGAIGNTGNILKTGAGTVILKGTNGFSGTTTVSEGTLTLDYGTNDTSKLHDESALILNGGTLNLSGGSHPEVVASTTLNPGATGNINLASGLAVINLNDITVGSGATLNFSGNSVATTDDPNTNGILGPWATVGGTMWAVNSTGGADGLINALTDFVTSFNLVNDNTLYQNRHVVVDSVQSPDAAINPLSLIFNTAAANSLTLQGTNTIASGGILVASTVGNNLSSLTGGSVSGPLDGALTINQRNTSNSLNIASSIVDNGTTSLLKTGPGLLLLSGNNTYSGTTTISAGSLQINSGSAIGGGLVTTSGINNAALVLGDGIVVPSSKSITIAGGGANQFFGALSTATGNTGTSEWQGPVTIGALTGTRIGTLGGTLHVSGNIGESAPGSQLLVRNNEAANGTTILSGNNTFSGGLQLVIGNLRMASANALGSGPLTLGGGNNVNAFSSDGSTPRSIANPVVFNGTTTHTLGNATLDGKLTFAGGASLGGATRTLGVASTVEFSSAIASTGTFGIVKTGVGDLILSAANTYTGATQINGGTLVVAHKDALATSSSVFPSTTAGTGTLRLATDTSAVINRLETSSSNPGTVVSDRATPGNGINHVIPSGWFGANTYTFAAGPNVTGGTAGITLNSVSLTAGSISTAVLNPTTAVLTINGPLNIGLNNFAKTLRLTGDSSGNLISGVISNGLNTLTIVKNGPGTWELSGDNSYTGQTSVNNGTLILSGNRTATASQINVGDVAGETGTLNIQGNLNMGANTISVGATIANAVGIINHTAGTVTFSGGGNALLIGRTTGGVSGTYNLSGGTLSPASSSGSRGVMIGVNAGSAGNLINATFNLSGAGNLNNTGGSGTLQVVRGDSASGFQNSTYNQTGGTSNNNTLLIGGNGANGANSIATFSVTGGTFTTTAFSNLSRGNNVVSTMTIGGTADVTLPEFPTARGTSSTATLIFDGGVLKPTANSTTYIGGLTNAFIQDGGAKFHTNGFDITVSQNLLIDPVFTGGGLTKEGPGTLALTGVNTYTGNTIVTGGTLSLGNGTTNTSLANGADVSVASGATLNLNYSGSDTIDELIINGVAKSPGIWGSSTSGAPKIDPQLTGSGTLTVTTGPAASNYENWASGYSLTGANANFDFDFDKDGIANGLEWILGGNPTTNSADILPEVAHTPSGDLVLTFDREEDSISEATLKVQFGTTLASWPKEATVGATSSGADANGVTVDIDTDASPDAVTVTIPAANADAGTIFARLIATQP